VRIEGTGRTVLGDPQVRALYLGLATARGNVDRDGGD
jgi:hypothetical protein